LSKAAAVWNPPGRANSERSEHPYKKL